MSIDISNILPDMMDRHNLELSLAVLPPYESIIRNSTYTERLTSLSNLYSIYVPCEMSYEIYYKLYLALMHSLQKKNTKGSTLQQNENANFVRQGVGNGVLGGSDSFTIIGMSGIGKSSAINRSVSLITEGKICIEINNPYTKIAPFIVVQCPFDSSVKGLLLEVLRKVDEALGSSYYEKSVRSRENTDMLIGSVSQVALNHIGVLIVDEIQNVVNSKNGRSLVGSLTQLINNSGISICMVGTPDSSIFFEQAMQLARRSLGLKYEALEYNDTFIKICETLFKYQYVKNASSLTEGITSWLYEHSGGITSVVVSLIHDAQEIAILTKKETLDISTLNEAYQKRLALLHNYIEPNVNKSIKGSARKTASIYDSHTPNNVIIDNETLFATLAVKSKNQNTNIVDMLKQHIEVFEVVI